MGYRTQYRLTANPAQVTRKVRLEVLITEAHLLTPVERKREVDRVVDVVAEVTPAIGDPFEEACKWYEHETHMREISDQFPEVLFTLTGEGEESGDLWVKYFSGGKMQHCPGVMTYEPFDENRLK